MRRPVLGLLIATGMVAATALASGCQVVADRPGDTITVTLRTAISELTVAQEDRDGYERDLFPHWIDADHDGCNTRYEILIHESVTEIEVGEDCELSGGEWFSYYDGVTSDSPKKINVDHFIPLAEAWDSGADEWTTERRQDFANDQDDERSLVAVTAKSNSSKSDNDPGEWLPEVDDEWCRYISDWVAVKTRWALSIDDAEKSALNHLAADCVNEDLTIEIAP